MTAKLTDRERWRRELTLWRAPKPLELSEGFAGGLAQAEAEAGIPWQKESELAVVRALLRLIASPNVRMPLSRLQ
jgi:hypothetical protein